MYSANQNIVSCRLTSGPLNWGRIVALFAFGYRVLVRVIGLGETIKDFAKVVSSVVSNIVRFITDASQGIARWIARQGGWVSEPICRLYALSFRFILGCKLYYWTVLSHTWTGKNYHQPSHSIPNKQFLSRGIYHQVISITSLKVHWTKF